MNIIVSDCCSMSYSVPLCSWLVTKSERARGRLVTLVERQLVTKSERSPGRLVTSTERW